MEGELHVPCGAKEGLRTYLPNRRSLLSYSSSNALHRTLMCSHVVLTSCSVSVNVVCVSSCVQGRAVLLSLVDMWCVVECVACHWVPSGDGV